MGKYNWRKARDMRLVDSMRQKVAAPGHAAQEAAAEQDARDVEQTINVIHLNGTDKRAMSELKQWIRFHLANTAKYRSTYYRSRMRDCRQMIDEKLADLA